MEDIELTKEELDFCRKEIEKAIDTIKKRLMIFGKITITEEPDVDLASNVFDNFTIFVNTKGIAGFLKNNNLLSFAYEFGIFILEHEILHNYIGNLSHIDFFIQKYSRKLNPNLISRIVNIVSDAFINSALLARCFNKEFYDCIYKNFWTDISLESFWQKKFDFFLDAIDFILKQIEDNVNLMNIFESPAKVLINDFIKISDNIIYHSADNDKFIWFSFATLKMRPIPDKIMQSTIDNLYTVLGKSITKFMDSEFIKELKSLKDYSFDRLKNHKYNLIVQEDILFPFKIKSNSTKEEIPNLFIVTDVSGSMSKLIPDALAISKFLISKFKCNKKFFIPFSSEAILNDLSKMDLNKVLIPYESSTNFFNAIKLVFSVSEEYKLSKINVLVITDGVFTSPENTKLLKVNTDIKFRFIYFLYTKDLDQAKSRISRWFKDYVQPAEQFLENSYYYWIKSYTE